MKKVVALLLLLSLIGSVFPAAMHAAVSPALYLDGARLKTDAVPRVVKDYTMVPVRVVAEQLGYRVEWTNKTKQVDIRNGQSHIVLSVGKNKADVNGSAEKLDAPAFTDDGVAYVPLRFVGEKMGLDVYWDKPTKSVHMTTHPVEPALPESPDESNAGAGGETDPGSEGSAIESPESPAPEHPGGEDGEVTGGEEDQDAESPASEGTEAGETALPPIPQDALAVVKSFEFDGTGRITVRYDGEMTPNEPFWTGTKLVIDVPYASLDPAVMADLAARGVSQGEMVIDTLGLQKVRYSYYSNAPSTVRIVFDLKYKQEFQVSNGEQEYYVDFTLTEPPAFTVVIDAGHGGKDPGAPSVNGKWEKEFNLALALKVNALLEKEEGITPYMTRSTDVFIELADRAAFANDLGADLFVSIHANRYKSSISGTETYYNRPESLELAKTLHERLVKGTKLPDRGVRKASFLVIRETTMPAVLLECGYLSNAKDAKALFTESVQDRIAQQIAAGIKEYAAAHGRK